MIFWRRILRLTRDEHCWLCGATLHEWHDRARWCGRQQAKERAWAEARVEEIRARLERIVANEPKIDVQGNLIDGP